MAKHATATLDEPRDSKGTTSARETVDPKGSKEVDTLEVDTKDIVLPRAITGIDDLQLDPDAVLGSRHTVPLLSGDPADGSAGIATLHKRAKITVSNGNFSIPVRFPPSTILLQMVAQVQQVYNGTLSKLNLGTTLNGTDVGTVDLLTGPTQVFANISTILPSNWTIYLSQVLGGATQGKCTILISYSVPAKTIPS